MRLTTTVIIVSFSSDLLSEIINVSATRSLSAIRLEPSARYKMSFFFHKRNKKALDLVNPPSAPVFAFFAPADPQEMSLSIQFRAKSVTKEDISP